MRITKQNIHKHELIGQNATIIATKDPGCIGLKGKIVDETKNTIKIKVSGKEKTLQKDGTVLTLKIEDHDVNLDLSALRLRPEDRIKKAKSKAVT